MGSGVGQYFVTHVRCRQARHSPQVPGNDQSRVQKWSVGLRRERSTGQSDHKSHNRTNEEGKNIRHYERGRDVSTNTGPAGFRQSETYSNPQGYEDYVELYSEVNWDIIGLDNGWFEQAFSSKYRVVRILTNICDSSVVGDDRTNVLGEAKVNAVMAEGQQYYEPTHLRYVPLRERELDVIEIILDDLNGSIVDLGIGITSVVLHFKRRGDIKSGHNC